MWLFKGYSIQRQHAVGCGRKKCKTDSLGFSRLRVLMCCQKQVRVGEIKLDQNNFCGELSLLTKKEFRLDRKHFTTSLRRYDLICQDHSGKRKKKIGIEVLLKIPFYTSSHTALAN